MAIPAITKLQQTAQKMQAARQRQQALSTATTQAGGTQVTPTTTTTVQTTPTVTTPKTTQTTTPNMFQTEEPYQSHISKWFGVEPGEKTKGVVTNLFDKLRPATEKLVDVGKAISTFNKTLKEEAKVETKDFEKRYTPEGLKQYFNYFLDELSPVVRPMFGNATYTSITGVEGITNWVNNTVSSIESRMPDQGLLVRKGILPASQTVREIEEEKERKAQNREAIVASVLDTVHAAEKWMDATAIGQETKSVEGVSLIDALSQGDTETARRVIGSNIGYMLPSIGAGIVGGEVGVAGSIFPVTYQDTLDDYMSDESILANTTPEQIHWYATASSLIQTAIEIISLETQVLKPIKNIKASQELTNKITQPVISRVIGQWLKGSAAESLEEITQQRVEQKFALLLGSNRQLLTVDDYADIGLEAFLIGLIISGPGTIMEGVSTKRQTIVYNENIRELREAIPGLTEEETKEILNAVIDYEEKVSKGGKQMATEEIRDEVVMGRLREEEEKLSSETTNINTQLSELNLNPTENQTQISQLETRLNEINDRLSEINDTINNMQQPLPAQPRQFIQREGGENLSQQTMRTVSDVRMTRPANRQEAQDAFRRSVEQVRNNIPYMETEFAKYAYTTSGRQIDATQKRRDKLISKVQTILNRAGITLEINNNLGEGVEGRYYNGTASYSEGTTNMIVYGHEVYHAMMDVVNNGTLSDKKLQQQLKEEMDAIIEMAKKYLYIDDIQYTSQESEELANQYAEEWLSNAFGEYLANRELPELGPKSFIERVENFFKRLINAISRVFNSDKRKMENVFRNILEGNIRKPSVFVNTLRGPSYMISPIESSTDITQDALKDTEGDAYTNIQRENETQTEQQELLASEPKTMEQIGKQAEKDNQTEETAEEAGQDETTEETTTPNTIREAMTGTPDQKKRAFRLMNTGVGQAVKDMFTPAISRLYNISPRIAGRVVTMEAQRDIRIHRYRQQAKPFVEAVSKLSKEDRLKLKKALLDYGALASEQTEETIAQYKEEQTAKLKETFKELGIDENIINDMFTVLNDLGQRYKDAGLSITLTDMYFPRVVTDYKGLSEFIGSKKELADLRNRIAKIGRNENMTDVEKENAIRRALTEDSKTPGTTSKHGKKRQLGLLSEFGEGIYKYYADPIEALDSYFVNMENAIQRQLFLGGLQEEAGLRGDNVSFSEIVEGLVDKGQISNEDLEEVKKTVLAILNKKPSPKEVSGLKNITYIATLTNFLSAINQLDDLGMTIIKNKSGLKNVVKTIFKRADIKYDELGLDDSYEMFREQGKVTNWLFRKSGFNTFDRLGKESFINTAWQSLIDQAKGDKSRENLISRLESMYGKDTAERMMEKIDKGDYKTDGQIDIEILTDLLYQLGSTQPIFTSAMPTTYLNHPWIRLCYALSSFTIKRIDWLIQGTKEVNKTHGPVAAGAWLMGVSTFLAMFGVAIGDVGDWIKGDEEETVVRKLINEGIDKALLEMWKEGKESRLKLWNVSLYDKNMYKRQGGWGVIMNKLKPAILGIGKDFLEAITEHNKDEMTDLIKYVPIIGKLLYYRFFDEINKTTASPFESAFSDAFSSAFGDAFNESFSESFDNAFNDAFSSAFSDAFGKAFK